MTSPSAAGINLSQDGDVLLVLEDGAVRRLDAATLWTECPSAVGRLRRLDRRYLSPPDDIRVVEVKPVGNYGVNIAFSDGHDRGIYPWSLLETLSEPLSVSDFLSA